MGTTAQKLQHLRDSIDDIEMALIEKGQAVLPTDPLSDYGDKIRAIPKGLDTSDATAEAGDILAGKTAYVGGGKVEGAMPAVAQAAPKITVSMEGAVMVVAEQEAGYVAAGRKIVSKRLTTQAAATITPGTNDKLAVAEGIYTTGDVYVAGDASLDAENIRSGVSIFGVEGTYSGGAGAGGEPCRVTISAAANVVNTGIAYINTDGDLDCAAMSGSELVADVTGPFVVSASVGGVYYLVASASNASSIRYALEGTIGANMIVITPKPGATTLTVTLSRSRTSPT